MRTPSEVVKVIIDAGIYPEQEKFMCHALSIAEDDIITDEEADATRAEIGKLLGDGSTTLFAWMVNNKRLEDFPDKETAALRMKAFWLEEFNR